jgi:hypothetical protein
MERLEYTQPWVCVAGLNTEIWWEGVHSFPLTKFQLQRCAVRSTPLTDTTFRKASTCVCGGGGGSTAPLSLPIALYLSRFH